MTPESVTNRQWRQIAQAILSDKPTLLDLNLIRAAGLSTWAHAQTSTDEAHGRNIKIETASAFGNAWQRHRAVDAAMQTLLKAWRAANLDVIVFKGFALANTVYAHPAIRPYADVDLLVRDHQLDDLVAVATTSLPQCFWREVPALYRQSATGHFYIPGLGLEVDVHTRVANKTFSRIDRSDLTEAAWSGAQRIRQPDLTMDVLGPADAALLGIAVNRGWSWDCWGPKAFDMIDLKRLIERNGLTREMIEQRATTLRLESTWAAFSDRCCPFTPRLTFPRNRVFKAWPERKFLPHSAPPRWALASARITSAPAVLRDCVRALPHLIAVLRLLSKGVVPQDIGRFAKRGGSTGISADRIGRGVRVLCRVFSPILPVSQSGFCVVRSTTLFRMLVHHGHDAHWVLGFAKKSDNLAGHAWVELNNKTLHSFADEFSKYVYVEAVRVQADQVT